MSKFKENFGVVKEKVVKNSKVLHENIKDKGKDAVEASKKYSHKVVNFAKNKRTKTVEGVLNSHIKQNKYSLDGYADDEEKSPRNKKDSENFNQKENKKKVDDYYNMNPGTRKAVIFDNDEQNSKANLQMRYETVDIEKVYGVDANMMKKSKFRSFPAHKIVVKPETPNIYSVSGNQNNLDNNSTAKNTEVNLMNIDIFADTPQRNVATNKDMDHFDIINGKNAFIDTIENTPENTKDASSSETNPDNTYDNNNSGTQEDKLKNTTTINVTKTYTATTSMTITHSTYKDNVGMSEKNKPVGQNMDLMEMDFFANEFSDKKKSENDYSYNNNSGIKETKNHLNNPIKFDATSHNKKVGIFDGMAFNYRNNYEASCSEEEEEKG